MPRDAARWRSPFARWVRDYGTRRLAQRLSDRGSPVTQLAIYHWVAGRCAPRIQHARVIVSLSHHRLGLNDVYAHRSRPPQAQAGQCAALRRVSRPPGSTDPGSPGP